MKRVDCVPCVVSTPSTMLFVEDADVAADRADR